MESSVEMRNKSYLPAVIFASVVTMVAGMFCNCPYAPVVGAAGPIAGIDSASNNTVYINGIAIDAKTGYLVIASFRVIVKNIDTDQFKDGGLFDDGHFNVSISIPAFAEENQTLRVEVTSPDGKIQYGNTTLVLTNVNPTSIYEVTVSINSPPPSYSWVLVIVFVIAFGLILAGYAIFTRWMVGKMVLRRADQIRLEEWKRKGGGRMQP